MARTGKTASSSSAELQRSLLEWYAEHARDLPWRRTRDPYAIWVSEVMLQQTQVATVIPYFERWLGRFPDVECLARADEHDVLHAWQGLGYYSRARSLLAGARAVLERHAGEIPSSVEALCALPGIGPYTAGAIASIAHGARAAIVDGNVERVLCRLFALAGDPKKQPLKRQLWQRAEALIPEGRASDFNQALMELGATLCTPRSPRCERCPWAAACAARARGAPEAFPEAAPRPKPTAVRMVAAVVERDARVLLTRLPDDAPRWAGLWQFPSAELGPGETPERALSRALGRRARAESQLDRIQHSVTRFRITLEVFRCAISARTLDPPLAWKRAAELATLAMPAAHRKIADRLTAAPGRGRARARP